MAKILIVDDDTTFCIMLRKWLEKRGFDVDTAFSYKDAVKQLDKAGFDLVLTDLRLPDKDGIDLLRVIKEKTPETQVLLMTGYADIQTVSILIIQPGKQCPLTLCNGNRQIDFLIGCQIGLFHIGSNLFFCFSLIHLLRNLATDTQIQFSILFDCCHTCSWKTLKTEENRDQRGWYL